MMKDYEGQMEQMGKQLQNHQLIVKSNEEFNQVREREQILKDEIKEGKKFLEEFIQIRDKIERETENIIKTLLEKDEGKGDVKVVE